MAHLLQPLLPNWKVNENLPQSPLQSWRVYGKFATTSLTKLEGLWQIYHNLLLKTEMSIANLPQPLLAKWKVYDKFATTSLTKLEDLWQIGHNLPGQTGKSTENLP